MVDRVSETTIERRVASGVQPPGVQPPAPRQASFATFWNGSSISAYEAACMTSFLRHGYRYVVYSYDPVENLPAGVERADAGQIADRAEMSRFIVGGRPNVTHFSDLFRYRLLRETPHIWVDTDMLMLRPLSAGNPATLLAREDQRVLCNAIMRLPSDSAELARLIAATEAQRDREVAWGATGPRLLTKTFSARAGDAEPHPAAHFFPVHYDSFWMVFLPEHRATCEQLCEHASTLHLWNNRVLMLGIWKRLAPPEGSFLHQCFASCGCLSLFDDTYPAEIVRHMAYNWRARCHGGEVGLGQWSRRAWPSLKLTVRRRLHLPT